MDDNEIQELKSDRSKVQDIITQTETLIEERMFALATGGLLASLTLFQIKPITYLCAKIFLSASWVLLLSAIFSIVFSLKRSIKEHEEYGKSLHSKLSGNNIDLEKKNNEITNKINRMNDWSFWLTISGLISFVVTAIITLV